MKAGKTTSERQTAWATSLPGVASGQPFATIVDALPVLVSYIDAQHRYRFLNKTYEQWFGGSRDAAVGKTVLEVLGPTLFERLKEPLTRALAGEPVKMIIPAFAPALGERQFEATFTPDIGPDGVVRGTVDLVTDVTDRLALERAQEETRLQLQATAARQELLATVSRAFAEGESNPPALLHTIAELVAHHFGDTVAITLRPSAGRGARAKLGFTWPVFHDRDEEASRALLDFIASNKRSLEDARLEEVLRIGRGEVGVGVEADQLPIFGQEPYRSWLRKFPVVSYIVAPLRVGARVIGAVVCTRRASQGRTGSSAFSEQDLQLLQEVADRAAISIENARLLAELNAMNAETDLLFELTDAVNRVESLDGVYAPALTAISSQLRIDRCALLLFDSDGVIRFKAWRGLSDEYRRQVEGHSPWKQDDQNPAPVLISDVQQAPDLAQFQPVFEAERIRALAFIPVVHRTHLLGKFMLYSDEIRQFSASEVKLAQAISDQVASAIGQKQVNAERERLIGELTQTLRLNELFAGILGHDLRNPLGAILMSATVLSRKATDPVLVRTAGRILTAGQRMNRMISQLLDFTRVRAAGTLPIQRTRLDLAAVMRQAIDEIPESAAGEGVRLEPVGDTQGWWDADRLAQAGSNLVSNALRHRDAGEVVVRMEGDDPGHVTLSVRNRGTIPENLLPVIWEPFQQGALRERRTGLGLGLFITREIVTAHAGSVQVECHQETGTTTFVVRLPRGNPPEA
ncbi:MAG: GAF domain-containing protein [Myxococcales bacterium]